MTFTSKPTVTTSLALDNAGDAEATVVHKFPGTPSTTVRVTTAGRRVMVDIAGDFPDGDLDIVVYVNDRTVQVFTPESEHEDDDDGGPYVILDGNDNNVLDCFATHWDRDEALLTGEYPDNAEPGFINRLQEIM